MKKDFNLLISTFRKSIKTWDYFVNWKKVFANKSDLEIILNKLNYLLGKEDIENEFKKLYIGNPDIVKALPVLLAVRENNIEIFDRSDKDYKYFDFSNNKNSFDEYFDFFIKTGLVDLFCKDGVKNLVDYVLGVEVGLDSNGRKNRGGDLMENIVEAFISDFCKERGYEFLSQVGVQGIKDKWGIIIKTDKSKRRFDFAVYNHKNKKIKILETNFYNGGGSKLKAVCGEFKGLYDELKAQNIDFIWITDGLGWETTKKPLEEAYNHNEYIFNLDMLESGILNKLKW